MKLAELAVLDDAEIRKIHAKSLTVLSRAGVRVPDAHCRGALLKAGAKADPGDDRVRLPSELVEECLKLAPPAFDLYGRDGSRLEISTESRAFGSLVIDPWIIDHASQRPRRPVLADVARHARLGDALDNVGFLYRMDMPPDDVRAEDAEVRTLEAFVLNTTKPMLVAPSSRHSLDLWLELGEILAEGRPLSERPFLCVCAPVTTPLIFHALNAEIMAEAIRRGLPLCAQTEPIAGTTAPFSFAGGVLMGNCENLFLVAMTQLLRPGTPIAYSVGNGLTDMRTGQAVFYPPDKMLWKIASAQMARFYRLPICGEATGSLVGRYDTQNGIEHALHMLPSVACGGGMFNGLGSCYNACGMSAEMVLIHSDLLRLLERIRGGIEVSDRMLDVEAIVERGPGGHFLEAPLTLEMLRSEEFFTEGCFDRLGERSPNLPGDSLLARAHRRVEELLVSHAPRVSPEVARAVQRWADGHCAG